MVCIKNNKEGTEILTDYCAGTLDRARALEIESHIQVCAECRQLTEAQRSVWEMLDAWKPLEVSSDFDAKLYSQIAREAAEPAWIRTAWILWVRSVFSSSPALYWKPLVAAGAVLSLALLLRVPDWADRDQADAVVKQTTKQATAAEAELRLGSVDLDQVEQALEDVEMLSPL